MKRYAINANSNSDQIRKRQNAVSKLIIPIADALDAMEKMSPEMIEDIKSYAGDDFDKAFDALHTVEKALMRIASRTWN